ncbi:hypothetical protein [Edwardsiella tarda]|uniref:Uncharacterized protein n=1 Tax=Edwardsiella tarda TaxID=636 RepID=A0A2A7U7C6_EDWTA|nr:hypothetical protein [Edwardsiella tarda]PEH74143.1 hypothetical protein CRM76_01670 [Edwardsiella tarda]
MFSLLKRLFSGSKNDTQTNDNTINCHETNASNHAENIDEMGNFIYNDSLNLDDYKYRFSEEFATLWKGELSPFSFSIYSDDDKRTKICGILTDILIDKKGEFVLQITDNQGAYKKYKESDVCTKFLAGSTRYKFTELCNRRLKINNDIFSFAKAVRHNAGKYVNTGKTMETNVSFTYVEYIGTEKKIRHKITAVAIGIQKNEYGFYRLACKNLDTNDIEYFNQSKIVTKIATQEYGKISFDEFKSIVFNVD